MRDIIRFAADRRDALNILGGGAALLGLGRTASAAPDASAGWDQVIAAAKQEGQVNFYNGIVAAGPKQVAAMFEKKYGIHVNTIEGIPTAIRERIHSEQAAGRFNADVHHSGRTTGQVEAESGIYEPYGTLPNATKLLPEFKADGVYLKFVTTPFGLLVNANLVKPEDEPTSWFDLIDPKWKGKILAFDPRSNGASNGSAGVFLERYGRGFLEKMAAQNMTFTLESRVAYRRIAQGEFPIYFPVTVDEMVPLESLPLRMALPKEGLTFVTLTLGIPVHAPHPNAARLFLNYFISDEAQGTLSEYGVKGTTGIISDKVSPAMRKRLEMPLLGDLDPHKRPALMKVLDEVFGPM